MRAVGIAVACLAGLLMIGQVAFALYARPDLEKVPVQRLLDNLETSLKDDPKNVELRFNLARVYAMAYALKSDTCEVKKDKDKIAAWFGFEPAHVPFKTAKTDDKDKMEAAKKMLAKAIERYKEVVQMDPTRLPARLGYAWCLEQNGDKEAAIKEYRSAIEDGWKAEKDAKRAGLGQHFITAEGAGYLIPLLDKDKDKEEIKTLEDRAAALKKLPRPITPIVVPLRDGLSAADLEDRNASVAFDADGSGLKRKWTWITKDAGWLVYDPKGKGEVTSGLQLFGNVTFWLFWDNGYHALASLDDNRDGQLTGNELRDLALWQDVNSNGVSDPGEVKPLSGWGITALSCRYECDSSHPDAIPFAKAGVTFRDGGVRPTFDIILRSTR